MGFVSAGMRFLLGFVSAPARRFARGIRVAAVTR